MSAPTKTVRLGDLAIPLRPWPTPDPVKCKRPGSYDGIGVLSDREIIALRPNLAMAPVWCSYLDDGRSFVVDDESSEYDGWFWLTEPALLEWNEGTDEAGRPCWSTTAAGFTFVIREYVIGTREGTMHAEWDLQATKPGERECILHEPPYLDLDEAKRDAAEWARDHLTRRAP